MHAIGRDVRVMEFIGPLMDLRQAREFIDGQIVNQTLFGHCFWPVERRSDRRLLGYCGLNPGPAKTPLEGGIEIAWQLAYDVWNLGFAREAAEAGLAWGWANLDVPMIAAITVAANTRSRALMTRLGMTRDPSGDFDHPALGVDDPLRSHILYRIGRPA